MNKYEDIIKQFLQMMEVDQKMRQRAINGHIQWDDKIDIENTKRLKKIIDKIGWPTISKVGKKVSKVAWLIAQHADHDLEFQKKALNLLQEAARNDEVEHKQVAYLTDRIFLKEGKKQIYGTQFKKNEQGKFVPLPLKEPENVNERRARVGLGTIEEYARGFDK